MSFSGLADPLPSTRFTLASQKKKQVPFFFVSFPYRLYISEKKIIFLVGCKSRSTKDMECHPFFPSSILKKPEEDQKISDPKRIKNR
jgi:hypothetical protein